MRTILIPSLADGYPERPCKSLTQPSEPRSRYNPERVFAAIMREKVLTTGVMHYIMAGACRP